MVYRGNVTIINRIEDTNSGISLRALLSSPREKPGEVSSSSRSRQKQDEVQVPLPTPGDYPPVDINYRSVLGREGFKRDGALIFLNDIKIFLFLESY